MLTYIKGNLFDTHREVICHGCNVAGGFGSGVAGQIAKRWPHVKQEYLLAYKKKQLYLGGMQLVPVGDNEVPLVANLFTQPTYGRTGIHVDYDACEQAFGSLFSYCYEHDLGVASPMIGAGLGGGCWSNVEERLLKILKEYDVPVDVYYL
jgi:O-acetyl-ADP-ribose deacetylase (regulator of RNase III)